MSRESGTFTLYGHPRSGNVYKPALMMALTETPFEFRLVDLPGGEQRSAEYLAMNPFGKVPTLTHGPVVIRQSNVMLLYLAAHTGRFGARDQSERLRISEWLFWEQDQCFQGIGRTRFLTKVAPGDPAVVAFFRTTGNAALDRIEGQLAETDYLAGDQPTIADVSVYAYARLAEDAGFDMSTRPRVTAWRQTIESLPGWKPPEALLA